MNDVVSVIIPIYNVEKYLDRCIESVVNQTYCNLEIILVDDGSPDNCPQMCDEWAARDSRIKVVHKQNAGLGMARNTGIDHATGSYICFFDGDDYVEPELVEKAYHAAVEYDADMVCFGMNHIDSSGNLVAKSWPRNTEKVYFAEQVQNVFLPKMISPNPATGESCDIPFSACSKLFSMRSICRNNWRFVSEREIISEDFYSVLKLFSDIETVCVLQHGYYNYCQNNASLSRAYRPDRFEKVCHFGAEIKKLCFEKGYHPEVSRRLNGVYLAAVMSVLRQEAACAKSTKEKKKAIAVVLHNEMLQQVLEETKNDKTGIQQKILFWTMRHRWVGMCYLLQVAKNMIEANKR